MSLKKKRLSVHDVSVISVLIAVGLVLRMFSPPIFGITPNWMIALYTVAILVIKPTLKQALGIGIVAALVAVPTSKAPIPWFMLVSEPVGALVAAAIALYLPEAKIKYKPILAGGLATIASGTAFVALTAMAIPSVIFLVMMGTVYLTAAVNVVLTAVLYLPVAYALGRELVIKTTTA